MARLKLWLDRVCIAWILAAPLIVLLGAWLGLIPPRDAPGETDPVVRHTVTAHVE